MDSIRHDLVLALRALLRHPGHALVAVLTLALGVGANTAIFSVINGVLLTPLEYPESDEIVIVWEADRENPGQTLDPSAPNFEDWKATSSSFEALGIAWGGAWSLTGDDLPPERVSGGRASPDLFRALGIEPVVGRSFREEETRGAPRIALISHALWTSRFAASPEVIGRTLTLDGERFEVIGVLPDVAMPLNQASVLLTAPGDHHVWLPIDRDDPWYGRRTSHFSMVIGRLAPGVTLEAAQAELDGIARALEERYPEANTGRGVLLRAFRDQIVGDVRGDLFLVLAAVTLVLLVACANLASLLLARAIERERDIAVRAAIGAGRRRLAREALAEVGLLGVAGSLLGLGIAALGTGLLLDLSPADLPRRSHVALDGAVLAYTLAVGLGAALLAGVLPTLRTAGEDPADALKSAGLRAGRDRRGTAVRSGLVVAQLALAVVLLVGCGLLLRTVVALKAVDPGADIDGVLAVPVLLPRSEYGTADRTGGFQAQLLERASALAGASSAVLAYDPPLQSTWWEGFTIVGEPEPAPGEGPSARFRPVSAGYFEAMGIPLSSGRTLAQSDRLGAPGAVVVNRALAERWFPGQDPVGRRILSGTPRANFPEAPEEWTIVGVVENVAFAGPREGPQPAFYIPLAQFPVQYFNLLVRTAGDPLALAPAARQAIWALDPDVPLPEATTLERLRDQLLARERFLALLASIFAGLALAVAAAGIFGVLSYIVAARGREMGVRQALGARPSAVAGLMLGRALRLAALGLGIGLVAALAAGPLLAGALFGVSPGDPLVLGTVLITLMAVATAAGAVPAIRAACVDPAEALRAE